MATYKLDTKPLLSPLLLIHLTLPFINSTMHIKQIESVLGLESKERYGYLIKKVADFEKIYLIVDEKDDFVTCGSKNDIVIPVFPQPEFAQELLKNEWSKCSVREMDLSNFLEWMKKLDNESYLIGGFLNRDLNSIIVSPIEIMNHLIYECQKYE